MECSLLADAENGFPQLTWIIPVVVAVLLAIVNCAIKRRTPIVIGSNRPPYPTVAILGDKGEAER